MATALDYLGDAGFAGYSVVRKVTLNYLDAMANSNKFYTLEIHEANGNYRVFTEYGRLGGSTRKQVRNASSLGQAEREFDRLLSEKRAKGYREVALVQSTTGSDRAKSLVDTAQVPVTKKVKNRKKSSLDPIVQAFVVQIFDEASRKLSQLAKGNVKSDGTSPLGMLSPVQIAKGRTILDHISNMMGRKGVLSVHDVIHLSNDYYSLIPRAFGRRITPQDIALNTQQKLSEEMDILKFYEDALRMGIQIEEDGDDIDKQYAQLHSDIELLSPTSSVWKDIQHYVNSTESRHHGVRLEVKNIFTVRQKKAPKFDDSYGNVKQLFHGSRSANLPGILSTHLKLPHQLSGVQLTGAMFGPGIYFADQSTKSSQYSCARFGGTSNRHKTAFMFLADVALGRVKKESNAVYHYHAPKGYDSVMGVAGASLLHNEYIVYREAQQVLRYIIEFEPRSRR